MSCRALIFDDKESIRRMLWLLFDRRGYEVFTFPNPASCPMSEEKVCRCETEKACADIILSDVNMPVKNGIEFVEEQIRKGCRCGHIALMSGDFTEDNISRAKGMGVKLFKKPFRVEEIYDWLDRIESGIDPERKLSDWFVERISKNP